jgi:aquaporin Z
MNILYPEKLKKRKMVPGKVSRSRNHNIYKYLAEAAGLALFMISACLFTALLEYPGTGIRNIIPSDFIRRIPMGIAMGLTAYGIITSPIGKRSGAHINPAITIAQLRLGNINGIDAFFYILFQFIGGLFGVLLCAMILGDIISDHYVNYVVTIPGKSGVLAAALGEFVIAVVMISMVLYTSSTKKWKSFTPLLAGILVMLNVIFEAPYSGFGMNPARTVASALPAGNWTGIWIYILIPVAAMLLVAECFLIYKKKKQYRLQSEI